MGTSALAFVFVILSGIVMWLPRSKKALVNSLKVNCSHGLHSFCHSFHVAVGVYTCLLLLCMALTGLTWSFAGSASTTARRSRTFTFGRTA